MIDKRGIEFSFGLIFSILVGVAILGFAIYGATKLIDIGEYQGSTELAKEFTIIFNPLETGLASGKSTTASIAAETRIYNECRPDDGYFGKHLFSSSTINFKKWGEKSSEISVYNKYIFSDEMEEGKKFYFFSKPFEMPFKISEIIFFTGKKYCFRNAPDFVKEEVTGLKLENINLDENCTETDVEVCFNQNCEISVIPDCQGIGCESEYDYGIIRKDGKNLAYSGSLMYAGIFSSPEIYSCNFKRLMARVQQLALLYSDEVNFLASRGCGTAILTSLTKLRSSAESADPESLQTLVMLMESAKELDDENRNLVGCTVYV